MGGSGVGWHGVELRDIAQTYVDRAMGIATLPERDISVLKIDIHARSVCNLITDGQNTP